MSDTPKFNATEMDIHSPFNACQHRGYCQSLLAELADARAERDAAVKDAERYRWLRDNAGHWDCMIDPGLWTDHKGNSYRPLVNFSAFDCSYSGRQFESAIDAAIEARKP